MAGGIFAGNSIRPGYFPGPISDSPKCLLGSRSPYSVEEYGPVQGRIHEAPDTHRIVSRAVSFNHSLLRWRQGQGSVLSAIFNRHAIRLVSHRTLRASRGNGPPCRGMAERINFSTVTEMHIEYPEHPVRMKELQSIVKMSRSWIYASIEKGEFPRPDYRFGKHSVAWSLKSIIKWLEDNRNKN